MRMTDNPAQQDANRKEQRTEKWMEHCANCFDELLAACKLVMESAYWADMPEAVDACRAAIAKAEAKP